MRITAKRISWTAGLCSVLAVACDGGTPLNAQSLESRAQAAGGNAAVSFTYPSRPGVCGNGENIIARRGADGEDFSIIQMEDKSKGRGTSVTNTKQSRAEMMRDCVDGPARVELTRRNGSWTGIVVTAGRDVRPSSLGTVTPQEATVFLTGLAEAAPHAVASKALFAATLSNAPTETATGLIALTRKRSVDTDIRKDAVFWLGQSDDARALPRLKEILADTREHVEVRESSIFALSLQDGEERLQALLGAARNANVPELRKNAIFWLGQKAADRATAGLQSILDDDSEEMEVREAAIFSLSQQNTEHAFTTLMSVARTAKEPALRRSAMFWLGQRDEDPRVVKLFEEILLKK